MRTVFLFATLLPFFLSAQESMNMSLLSNIDLPDLPTRFGSEYNDCWGYRSGDGTEIAVIGGTEDIFFFDVTVPANPVLIHTHHVLNSPSGTTNQSLWRDFKSYGQYVYAAADEGTSGLLIFDMSDVPESVTMVKQTVQFWNRSHNIFIDVLHGKLYSAGTNSVNNGLVILDLTSDPADPDVFWNVPLNGVGGGYVHDVFVSDNIAYCSHGSLSKLQMYDFSGLPNFTVEGTIEDYPDPGYNHSSWLNSAGNMLAMADETHGSKLKLVDVSDPLNISSDDFKTFFSELLGPDAPGSSVAHNPFILGDLVYVSYYHDGVQVFDISDPDNIEVVAYYDTYPDNDGYAGYDGCWGVYPFLASGIIIASDQNYGLYVLQIDELPLDIEFISFDAYRQQTNVKLEWVVADASNGNQFEINRSTDGGLTFQPIGKVNLTTDQSNYDFTDDRVVNGGKYVYRIDFVQDDGAHILSPLRHVRIAAGDLNFRVVNPVSSSLIVDVLRPFDQLYIELYNIEGQPILRQDIIKPGNKLEFNLAGIPAGHYVLSITSEGKSENLIIQKFQ